MLGGYFLFTLASIVEVEGIGQLLTVLLLAFILSFAIGALLYYIMMRPMVGQPVYAAVIVTIGLSILLRGLATFIWTSDFRYLTEVLRVGNSPHSLPWGAVLSTFDLLTLLAAAVFLGGLGLFFRFSRLGVQMRAASENPLLAAQRGLDIYMLFALSWSIATLGASFAGILYGANVHLDPEIGFIGLKAFPVAMVGGMDSLLGVIPGGIIVALAEVAAIRYWDPLLGGVVPMVILLLALIIRPWGLFGRKEEIERV